MNWLLSVTFETVVGAVVDSIVFEAITGSRAATSGSGEAWSAVSKEVVKETSVAASDRNC